MLIPSASAPAIVASRRTSGHCITVGLPVLIRATFTQARSTSKWSANMLSMPSETGMPRDRYSTTGAMWPRTAFISGQWATVAFDAASTSVSESPTT